MDVPSWIRLTSDKQRYTLIPWKVHLWGLHGGVSLASYMLEGAELLQREIKFISTWPNRFLYLAPGPRSPATELSPLWCYQYAPRPWKQQRGWNLQPRWPATHRKPIIACSSQESRNWANFTYFFFTPYFIDGSLSSSPIWSIYDVVMHQAGSVDHLWDHRYGPLSWEQVPTEGKDHDRLQEVRWLKTESPHFM